MLTVRVLIGAVAARLRMMATMISWFVCGCFFSFSLQAQIAPALLSSAVEAPGFELVGGPRSVPNGIVTAIAQDRDGLLWLGSTDGLVRYDGYRFTRWPSDQLPAIYVRSLLATRDGGLWVALQNDGVYSRSAGASVFVRNAMGAVDDDPLLAGDVLAMAEDLDGSVWFAHAQAGLDRLGPDGQTRQRFLPNSSLRTVLVDGRGDLWVGGRGGLLRKRAGADVFESISELKDRYVYALYAASNGELWVGTQDNGAAVLDAERRTVAMLPMPMEPDGVAHPWVDGFAERVPGELWLATFGGGVEVRDLRSRRVLRRFTHDPDDARSLAMDRVPSLLRDPAGHLWVPTWGAGLQRVTAGFEAVQSLRARAGEPGSLRHPTVMSTLSLPDGRLWVGASGVGIDVLDAATKKVVRSFDTADGLGDGTVRALARSADGQIWAGTQQTGLHRFIAAENRFETLSAEWPERRVRRLAPAQDGAVWVALELGLLRVGRDGRVIEAALGPGRQPLEQPVWAVTETRDGVLWVGTPGGLFMRSAGESALEAVAFDSALADRPRSSRISGVLDIAVADSGEVWVLAQRGIYRRPPTQGASAPFTLALAAIDVPQGLGMQLLHDPSGVLWTGRVRLDPRTGKWQSLGPSEGIDVGNPVWPAGSVTADGQVILGGTNGLAFIDPTLFVRWDYQPQVVATRIEIDGLPSAVSQGSLVLPAGPRRLSVEFSALDLSDPESLRYRYRLEGQDEAWVETDASQRVATYGNLWPGDYQLVVQGSNRVGDWSEHELVLPVRVEAAIWQTRSFALMGVIALIGLIFAVSHWRAQRVQQQARRLQSLVDERTDDLRKARDASDAALIELRDAQGRLVEAEKMASLGQMVAGVAHELNTPMGNALVVSSTLQQHADAFAIDLMEGRLKRSELEDFLRVLSEGCQLMGRSVERAHDLVSSFKQVAVDRSSSKRRTFDLATVVAESLVMLGPTLKRQPCDIQTRVLPGLVMDSYPGAISQIVENMVNNALVHAFDGRSTGSLLIEAERIETSHGEAVRLSFIDDGVGMDEGTRKRIFEPFFTTRMGSGGTGLGLHIVYNLVVQLLGGRIDAGEVLAGGARFDITIPFAAPMAPEEPADLLS